MSKKPGKENRKEKILAAAASCFTEFGYFKTSMEMVSNKADMTLRGLLSFQIKRRSFPAAFSIYEQ